MTDRITIELDRAIAFRTHGEPVIAHGIALVLTGDGVTAPPAAELTFRVEMPVYERLVEEALFEVHGEPEIPFEEGRELEIEARLRPDVAAELIARGGGAEDLVGALVAPGSPAAFVAEAESWQARSVMQTIDGDVTSGYRMEPRESMLEVVRGAAARAGTPLEDTGSGLHRLMARGDAWTTVISIDETARVCAVYAVAPANVPAERRAEVAQFLVDRNYYLGVGAFEMDLDDGEVRLRTSIDATHAAFDEAVFVNLVAAAASLFELHLPALQDLAAGVLSLAEARARF